MAIKIIRDRISKEQEEDAKALRNKKFRKSKKKERKFMQLRLLRRDEAWQH